MKELYLAVCREKDSLEDHMQQLISGIQMFRSPFWRFCFNYSLHCIGRRELEEEKNQLLRELEDINKNLDENLNKHKAMVEANWDAKLQTAIQEQLARARLEWLREKTSGQVDDLVHVEKSLGKIFFRVSESVINWYHEFRTGELQCLRDSMDALRHERDVLQNEVMKRQQQLKLERHLLREKFEVEKKMLIKSWQEKVTAASLTAADKSETQQSERTLITATADAMVYILDFLITKNIILKHQSVW